MSIEQQTESVVPTIPSSLESISAATIAAESAGKLDMVVDTMNMALSDAPVEVVAKDPTDEDARGAVIARLVNGHFADSPYMQAALLGCAESLFSVDAQLSRRLRDERTLNDKPDIYFLMILRKLSNQRSKR